MPANGAPQGQGPPTPPGPPYPPRYGSLGGVPDILPDVPATFVFLFLYVVFAITHVTILKKNLRRGHKFLFSGALFGFCAIRIITMILRIAWAFNQANISLGIAAQIFVYVGTIILFIVNWFFTQRIVRAQHARWGWSMPYRVLHRVGLFFLIVCLLLLIVAAIQQFFTLDANTLNIDRDLQLTGQTYFAIFCFAPVLLIGISQIVPRRGTEKFGAGRLRNNITIVVIAALVLSLGQIFRTATAWLPQSPLRNAQGQPNSSPWYLSKACFYIFNFTTEIFVVIFYALCRVDLRFHIANGASKAGDYVKGREEPPFHVDVLGDEKKLKRASTANWVGTQHANDSKDTLHEYEASIFDDTRTLADSLRYPSSILEVDQKTGHYKIKRASGTPSISSARMSRMSHLSDPSIWSPDRDTLTADAPPVPTLPTDWPLRESQLARASGVPRMEHAHRGSSAGASSDRTNEFSDHGMNGVDMSDAVADAIAKLEANSEVNKRKGTTLKTSHLPPPDYDEITPIGARPGSDIPMKHLYKPSSSRASSSTDLPKKHLYDPRSRASSNVDTPKRPPYATSSRASSSTDLPKKHSYTQGPRASTPNYSRPSSEIVPKQTYSPSNLSPPKKAHHPSSDLPQKHNYRPGSDLPNKHSYQLQAYQRPGSDLPTKIVYAPPQATNSRPPTSSGQPSMAESENNSRHSNTTSRATSAEYRSAQDEFRRFSFEAPPRDDENYEYYEGSMNESERSLERRSRK
ncbi:hypothetical protein EJ04DRAFT_146122 [Polyplosphaeria fusca]|uniref:Uncharacterized protein n=1 Tax=Polyplosphaeria fusca TaxID=682080 RepID=A0A9P4QIZ0_9PLEO|nr:hypothetical protein EJ04DRAFT_146122 [Polyplosphaeria fusca]